MPRSLDTVSLGGYVEGIEVDEDELNSVVAMLEITDPERASAARDQIYNRLEDLKTARSRTAKAKPIRSDNTGAASTPSTTRPAPRANQGWCCTMRLHR